MSPAPAWITNRNHKAMWTRIARSLTIADANRVMRIKLCVSEEDAAAINEERRQGLIAYLTK